MIFFSRFGYLAAVFFLVAAVIAAGVSAAYHLSRESTGVLLLLFWGPPCVFYGKTLDHGEKRSTFLRIPLEYWGYGVFALGVLDAYVSWDKIARDWLTAI